MALQFVGGKATGFAGTTSDTAISLTDLAGGLASAPSAGDLVIVAYGAASAANNDEAIGVTSSGYTERQEIAQLSSGQAANLSLSWKRMGATPDSSVSVSGTGNSANGGAVAIHVWRGVDGSVPFDVADATDGASGNDNANPPAITPSTAGAVVIAVGCGASFSGGPYSASDLSHFFSDKGIDDADCPIGIGSIAWSSGAVDPAQFTGGSGGNSNRSWAAVTLVLRPQTSTAYLIAADTASYALSGTAAAARLAWRMAAAAGTNALVGTAAALKRGYVLAAGSGSSGLTGTSAALRKALKIAGAGGSLALAGAAAICSLGYRMGAGIGSLLVSRAEVKLGAELRIFAFDETDPRRAITLAPIERRLALRARPSRRQLLSPLPSRTITLPPIRRGRSA